MRLIAATLLACTAMAAWAGDIYQYRDKSGQVVYSDTLPPGVIPIRVLQESGVEVGIPAASPEGKGTAEKEMEFRQRQAERGEQQAKAEKEAAEADSRRRNCESARNQLSALESGQRIARYNAQGEREFLEDAQRAAETERARKAVADWCK